MTFKVEMIFREIVDYAFWLRENGKVAKSNDVLDLISVEMYSLQNQVRNAEAEINRLKKG